MTKHIGPDPRTRIPNRLKRNLWYWGGAYGAYVASNVLSGSPFSLSKKNSYMPSRSRTPKRARRHTLTIGAGPTPRSRSRSSNKMYTSSRSRSRNRGRTLHRVLPRRLFTNSRQTGKRRVSFQPTGSAHSIHGGFFKPSKHIDKRQRQKFNAAATGVTFTKETGFTVSGVTDACYVGQATFVQSQLKAGFVRLLLKMLFKKRERNIRNWLDTADADMTVGDVITILYKADSLDSTAEQFAAYTFVATNTWESIANSLFTSLGNLYTEAVFTRIQYQNSGDSVKGTTINLLYASVYLDCKSSLKIQNITAGPAGLNAENVDNIPLYGRSYYGKGTGTSSNRTKYTEVSLVANEDTGIIYKTGTLNSGTSEMPPAEYFTQCRGTGKVKIDPGAIKASVLTDTKSYSIQKFTKYLYNGYSGAKDLINTGKFAFFGFQHLIKATNTDPTISLKAEHNYYYSMTMVIRNRYITDMKVEQAWTTF